MKIKKKKNEKGKEKNKKENRKERLKKITTRRPIKREEVVRSTFSDSLKTLHMASRIKKALLRYF